MSDRLPHNSELHHHLNLSEEAMGELGDIALAAPSSDTTEERCALCGYSKYICEQVVPTHVYTPEHDEREHQRNAKEN